MNEPFPQEFGDLASKPTGVFIPFYTVEQPMPAEMRDKLLAIANQPRGVAPPPKSKRQVAAIRRDRSVSLADRKRILAQKLRRAGVKSVHGLLAKQTK